MVGDEDAEKLLKFSERIAQILAAAGGTSVDRSSKATLLLTVPGGMFKSSTRDLSVRPFGIAVEALLRWSL